MRSTLTPLLLVPLALTACAAEEEPVANRFDRQKAAIENKAREISAEAENQVRAVERDMQNQIDALANQQNAAGPAEANAAAPAPAPGNSARR